jgi:2-polyprenyl-3-methyl-5-hydroxy-6-metoxy-1,4-benzoquinol methylase
MRDIFYVNKKYYDELYQSTNVVLRWIHSRISFDQQSKCRPNKAAIDTIFKEMVCQKGHVKVLDYGCGWGNFLMSLPRRQVEAYCYDISEPAMSGLEDVMRMLKRNVSRIDFGEDGRIIPEDIDLIICSHVLEHVEDDRRLLVNLTKALRPGGYLLINVPINETLPDPKHLHSYTPEILKMLMMETGLKIEEERQVGKLGELLSQSRNPGPGIHTEISSIMIRALRALFSLLPYKAILLVEGFLSSEKYHQLIMVGRK